MTVEFVQMRGEKIMGSAICGGMGILLSSSLFGGLSVAAEEVKNISIPVVVRFSNAVTTPFTPEFTGALSRDVGITLSYLHQAPDGNQVFQVNGLFADFRLTDLLQRMQMRGDVISAFEDGSSNSGEFSRIIVKFSESVADPSLPAFVSGLFQDVGVTLAYSFEKGRGVHALRVNGLTEPAQIAFVLQRLKRRKDILSADLGGLTSNTGLTLPVEMSK